MIYTVKPVKLECCVPLHSNPSIKFFNWGLMSSGRTKGSLTICTRKKTASSDFCDRIQTRNMNST